MPETHVSTGRNYDSWYFSNSNSPAAESVETNTGDPVFESGVLPKNLVEQLKRLRCRIC
jgi:hypothetical protein